MDMSQVACHVRENLFIDISVPIQYVCRRVEFLYVNESCLHALTWVEMLIGSLKGALDVLTNLF